MTAPSPDRSALVVAIPEAEAVVGRHRATLDRSAIAGVPAHVTVLYPFLPPAQLDAGVRGRLAELFAVVSGFDCDLAAVRWFGEDLVYLAPEPDATFRALTRAVHAEYPQCPPYAGKHAEVVPHLTVAERRLGTPDVLRDVAAGLTAYLPVPVRVREVRLLVGCARPASWTTLARFPLAGA